MIIQIIIKTFSLVAHNEDSEKSFVIILLPSWQTLSGCLPTLELKSPLFNVKSYLKADKA